MASEADKQIVITGSGLVTPLGLDAATSCAAARAGLSRAAALDTFSVYSPEEWGHVGVVGHVIREFTEGYESIGKILRLASLGFADLIEQTDVADADPARLALVVGLTSFYHEAAYAHAQAIERGEQDHDGDAAIYSRQNALREGVFGAIAELSGLAVPRNNIFVLCQDAPGFALALREASRLLAEERFERMIVGGVDSTIDADLLTAALHFGLLKTPGRAMGFQPGEAAAFLQIETRQEACRRHVAIAAGVLGPAVAQEPAHRVGEVVSTGEALAEAISGSLAPLAGLGRSPSLVVGNLNGDPVRSSEWGSALVRLRARHPALDTLPVWSPASSFGETGAAAGAVAACLVCRAFDRNYAPSAEAAIWMSADNGLKGAFCLSRT